MLDMRSLPTQRFVQRAMLLGALMLGCSAAPKQDTTPPRFVVADVIVSVTNQSPGALQIYAGTSVLELPLGTVSGRSSRSFSLPSELGRATGPLHFEARTLRQTTGVRSDTFRVSPGQQVRWTVEAHLSGPVTMR